MFAPSYSPFAADSGVGAPDPAQTAPGQPERPDGEVCRALRLMAALMIVAGALAAIFGPRAWEILLHAVTTRGEYDDFALPSSRRRRCWPDC
jgi:hypothetical protein